MKLTAFRELGSSPIPTMPDGSVAFLPIDDSAGHQHLLSEHGWPPNNIQEYTNHENLSISEAFVKNLEIQRSLVNPDANLSDAQKAALCGSRYAKTASEFVSESLRLDGVRRSFEYLKVDKELDGSGVKSTEKVDDLNTD